MTKSPPFHQTQPQRAKSQKQMWPQPKFLLAVRISQAFPQALAGCSLPLIIPSVAFPQESAELQSPYNYLSGISLYTSSNIWLTDSAMGFPVGYSELPKLLLHLLFLLAHLRKLTNWACRCLGLGGGLSDGDVQREGLCLLPPVLAEVIEEASPATRFEQLPEAAESCCAVCLCEFELEDEVRRMSNCRHVFHRQCVDRWIQHRQRTCPLCRVPLVPFHSPPATPEDDEDYYYSYSLRPLGFPSA